MRSHGKTMAVGKAHRVKYVFHRKSLSQWERRRGASQGKEGAEAKDQRCRMLGQKPFKKQRLAQPVWLSG